MKIRPVGACGQTDGQTDMTKRIVGFHNFAKRPNQQKSKEQITKNKQKLVLILVNVQIDAQILCFIISLLQSSTCFEHCCAHHQEVKFY
jgi:hypothetical protein